MPYEGEPGLGLIILTKGTVRITWKNSSDGAEQVLGTAGAGDVVGEMALLEDLPRSATATAVDGGTALKRPVGELGRFMRPVLQNVPRCELSRSATSPRPATTA